MTQIRKNLTKLFGAFAVLFILFIMFDWGMDLPSIRFRGEADVLGKVNDEKITYKEFSELLRQSIEAQKKQSGTDPSDDLERQIRDQVWNMLVNQILIREQIEELGIEVTDKEIIEMVHGPNPPEMLVGQFRDSLGRFNRDAYDQAIQDPRNRDAWLQIERQLRQQRKSEKLQSLLNASVRVTEGEVKQKFIDQNTYLESQYVLFDPNMYIDDSKVTVTDADLQKYYKANPSEYKVKPARKLKYVLFQSKPSNADTSDVVSEIERLKDQVQLGMDFAELAKTHSEIPASEAFFKHGELSRNKEIAVFEAKKGQVVGPIIDFDGVHLVKVLDERRGNGEFVRASHILINETEGTDAGPAEAKARKLLQEIKAGADFSKLASANSEDEGSADLGGDLGWGGKGTWVKPFEDAAFKARVGEVVGPIRSKFGWHIIKVTGRDSREVKISSLTMKIKTSPQTIDQMYSSAQDFSFLAGSEGFEKSAELSGYQVKETPEFIKGGFIPGIGFNDFLMNFSFSKKLNAVSDPISISNGVAVFMISSVKEEGIRPFEEVRSLVQEATMRQKKMEIIKRDAEGFHQTLTEGDDLLVKAATLQNVTAQNSGSFRPTDAPLGVGRDNAFVGVALSLKRGEISKPFEGTRGYYIMKLMSKSDFDSTKYAQESNFIRDQILQEKRNRFTQEWLGNLREQATIVDNRDRFFR